MASTACEEPCNPLLASAPRRLLEAHAAGEVALPDNVLFYYNAGRLGGWSVDRFGGWLGGRSTLSWLVVEGGWLGWAGWR